MLRFAWRRQPRRQDPIHTRHNKPPAPSAHSPPVIEPLEPRSLLSWPPLPTVASRSANTIYVNQNGTATLTNQQLKPGREFQSDQIYFDDSGQLSFNAISRIPLDTAVYTDRRRPVQVNTAPDARGSGVLAADISPVKDTLYLAVRPHAGTPTAIYTLLVRGVPSNFIEPLAISPTTNTGYAHTDISGTNDYDFFRFTTSRAGNWTVRVTPTPVPGQYPQQLDATMNIYTRRGRPVPGGGTFTTPINQNGPGAPETWVGTNLHAHTTYYVRIDGAGDSTGLYHVSVTGP